ncbi:protein CNPPD1 [Eupeodes corollae]|uniref:protein CNPPD1 n=1 Tax=Eupeodes corollae TaxID=290404 RepID=UPI0024933171|nr:protein CNPPD1 [Eupeodes corollae]XP_055904082.1 protein CNPPD1 [Eupeodes corollae]
MALGRNKCVIKGGGGVVGGPPNQKVMQHNDFIDRIRKSLYFGEQTLCEDMEVSGPLAEYASELFSEPHKGHSLNRLNKVTAGSVHATPCSLIMALIYLDRLNATDPGYVRRITPSELFIVSMMISTKFYSGHDEEIYLSDWAEDGNMTEDRLKQLELEFLCAIDWNIYISNENFFAKLTSVEKTLAKREGLRRGWLTYTELIQFLPSFTIAKFLLNNITVMAVSYAASVMTIAGAFFLASQIPGNALHHGSRRSESNSNTNHPTTVPTSANQNMLNSPVDMMTGTSNSPDPMDSGINITCSAATAFNVEEELQKLELQYLKEQYLDSIRMRNNENDKSLLNYQGASRRSNMTPRHRGVMHDSEIDWYSFKDEYSEDEQKILGCPNLTNCSTKSLLWNLLADAENSFVKFPFMWFKFM